MKGWKFVFSARWAGYFALVVVFGFACYLLGNWQFARLAETREAIARVDANYDAAPVPLNQLLPGMEAFDSKDEWRSVEVSGHYLSDQQVLVRTRPLNGDVGFEVLVPLQLENGSVLAVDRGWVASGESSDSPDFVPAPPSGQVTVVARLKPGEPEIPGRSAPKGQLATIQLDKFASLIGLPTYTGAYGLMASETPAAAQDLAALPRPEDDEGPHLSYALQWIAFAILAVIGLVWAIRQEHRVRNSDDPRVRELEARRKARKLAKGPSDAEIEDAQIERAAAAVQASSINSE